MTEYSHVCDSIGYTSILCETVNDALLDKVDQETAYHTCDLISLARDSACCSMQQEFRSQHNSDNPNFVSHDNITHCYIPRLSLN